MFDCVLDFFCILLLAGGMLYFLSFGDVSAFKFLCKLYIVRNGVCDGLEKKKEERNKKFHEMLYYLGLSVHFYRYLVITRLSLQ